MGIYLDNQASTPVDPRVKAVMIEAMEHDFANPSSESHSAGWQARERVEQARATIAKAIGCGPDELIFTSGATEADNIGVLGAALGAPESRRRILVGATEHKAVLEAAFAAQRSGFSIELLPVDGCGLIDPAELRVRLSDDVAVVSVMLVNNEIGTIQPLDEIVRLSTAAGAFVHTDATQAPTAMDIDIGELGVDAASFSSHKIYGPKGIGALYISAAAPWRPRPLMFGGGQELGLRPGTLPTHLCAGFAEAFAILTDEGAAEREWVARLRDDFAQLLGETVASVKLTAAPPKRHPGNLHVRFDGIDADDLLARLQPQVCAATGSACTSGHTHYSHVLEAIGQPAAVAGQGVRFSLGRFSDDHDVRQAVEFITAAVEQIVGALAHQDSQALVRRQRCD
uniref:cysteine desulfurase family protein n=1 Tax=Altererythrobacter segetis TaxID=1104773 RepID=UPI00140A9FA5|nr:cysteine desulfurase family protein [Altererythrobacter segetis]